MRKPVTHSMVAIRPCTYNTRHMTAGDRFEVFKDHVRLVEVMGWAKPAPKAARGRPRKKDSETVPNDDTANAGE